MTEPKAESVDGNEEKRSGIEVRRGSIADLNFTEFREEE